jgi:hypothetical protein
MSEREQPDPGDGWRLATGDDYKDHRCEVWCDRWAHRFNVGKPFDADPDVYYRIPDDAAQPDLVSSPTHHGGDHYQGLAIQPWDYATANRMEYNEGVVVAYVTRWRSKGGLQDLQKAIDHINKIIEYATKKEETK